MTNFTSSLQLGSQGRERAISQVTKQISCPLIVNECVHNFGGGFRDSRQELNGNSEALYRVCITVP